MCCIEIILNTTPISILSYVDHCGFHSISLENVACVVLFMARTHSLYTVPRSGDRECLCILKPSTVIWNRTSSVGKSRLQESSCIWHPWAYSIYYSMLPMLSWRRIVSRDEIHSHVPPAVRWRCSNIGDVQADRHNQTSEASVTFMKSFLLSHDGWPPQSLLQAIILVIIAKLRK